MTFRPSTIAAALILSLLIVAVLGVSLSGETHPLGLGYSVSEGPSWACPTGRDHLGRCIGASLIYGTSTAAIPGVVAMAVCVFLGIAIGIARGYGSSTSQKASGLLVTVLESMPRLVALLILFQLSNFDLLKMGLAIGLFTAPGLAEEISTQLRLYRQEDYIESARAHGLSERRIVWVHLIWLGCRTNIVRHSALAFGYALVVQTTLSYALQARVGTGASMWGNLLVPATLRLVGGIHQLSDFFIALGGRINLLLVNFKSSSSSEMATVQGNTFPDMPALPPLPDLSGLLHFSLVAGTIVSVLWATQTLSDSVIQKWQGGSQ